MKATAFQRGLKNRFLPKQIVVNIFTYVCSVTPSLSTLKWELPTRTVGKSTLEKLSHFSLPREKISQTIKPTRSKKPPRKKRLQVRQEQR